MNEEQKGKQLYLIMTDKKNPYSLHRIEEPEVTSGEDEATIINLEKPLLEMDRSIFPQLMVFAAVDTSIFMVGGLAYDEGKKIYRASKNVFIYNTDSSTLVPGPKLNSRCSNSHPITLGSKLFVLSNIIYTNYRMDDKPSFEMLDTDDLKSGWSPLPLPTFTVESVLSVDALAAVYVGGSSCSGGIIVLSSCDAGTYVFDVDKQVWNYVTDEPLPFEGTAVSLPQDPSICCAYSLKSQRFSAFRFCYRGDESNSGFQVEEIWIDTTDDDFHSPLSTKICYRPRKTVPGADGLIYFVDSGSILENRYVEVSALQLSNLNHDSNNKGQSLTRCGMKNRHIADIVDEVEITKLDLNKGQSLKRGTNKKKRVGHDEKRDGIILEVDLSKTKSSKRDRKKREMGHVKEEKEETKELTLSRRWRRCYFAGPVCDRLLHVAAAFAI